MREFYFELRFDETDFLPYCRVCVTAQDLPSAVKMLDRYDDLWQCAVLR
ncbi:hypothetical protein [Phenylobacterium koreense]|uniref:DUF3606 domain-containing protein n=1 Tax=Phenylobacterium koreense TaxID=266125 RepID=A0ABV2EHH1_9CAUL